MAKDAVDRILEAERNAEKLENDASIRAAEIVSAAEAEAAAMIEKSRAFAEESAARIVLSAQEESKKIIADAASDKSTEAGLKGLFENKREDAINAVITILKE